MRARRKRISAWLEKEAIPTSFGLAVAAIVVVVYLAVSGDVGKEAFRNVSLVLAAIVAFPVLVWRTTVGVREANSADESLLNERFQSAAKMLGNKDLVVRTAGAQSFGDLAKDAPERYHVRIMRLLCAFARNPTSDSQLPTFEPGGSVRLREDVQAAINVIGSRRNRQEIEHASPYEPNLIDADLKGARLWGTYLARSICIGADFTEARLGNVDFEGANLESASFARAYLTGEGIDNPDAKDKPVNLRSAILAGVDFDGADLTGVDISGADFARGRGRSVEGGDGTFERGAELPAVNLTQDQLLRARADTDSPPKLDGVVDAASGEPLIWHRDQPTWQVE